MVFPEYMFRAHFLMLLHVKGVLQKTNHRMHNILKIFRQNSANRLSSLTNKRATHE